MKHDLILFDLDGTLIDPIEGIGKSFNFALARYGYDPLDDEAIRGYIGPPLDYSFREILGEKDPEKITGLISAYRERYVEVGYAENLLYPGIEGALADLKSLGYPLAVCTSKRADYAEKILARFGLADYFDFVSGGDIGIHKWQQISELVAQGNASTETLMIGDRAVDLVAAHRNGLSSGGVLWGYGGREELEAESPTYVFSTVADLPILRET